MGASEDLIKKLKRKKNTEKKREGDSEMRISHKAHTHPPTHARTPLTSLDVRPPSAVRAPPSALPRPLYTAPPLRLPLTSLAVRPPSAVRGPPSALPRPLYTAGNSYRVSKEEKKKKKKSSADSKVVAEILEPHIMKDKTLEISEGKKKSRKSRDKKRNESVLAEAGIEELDASHTDIVENGTSGGENAQTEQAEDKFKKSRKKKRKNVEFNNKVDECNEKDGASQQKKDFEPEDHILNPWEVKNGDTSRISKTGKSKKPGKMKKKQLVENDLSLDTLLEKRGEDAEDEVYQLSSGDEDYSKGMKKWITEYYESRPGIKVLQERIDDFIMAHEAKEEQARSEREAQAAEGGWTVVVHQKGRKKTTDAESGIAVGSVAQAAVVDKMGKKKKKDIGLDFYRFQKREAHRNEIMMLQSKFEQDKKRIQQMRATRKFRPY